MVKQKRLKIKKRNKNKIKRKFANFRAHNSRLQKCVFKRCVNFISCKDKSSINSYLSSLHKNSTRLDDNSNNRQCNLYKCFNF